MSDKSRMQTIHLSPYVSVQGTAEELARKYPPLPDEGDRVANLRNRVEMRQIMDDQLTVLVPLGELRAVFAVLDSMLPNVQQLQDARDAAEAREQALLSTYDAERKALVENAAMRHDIARLTKSLSDEVTARVAAEAEVARLTAALAASRAAHDCHQPDLVTAAQVRIKPLVWDDVFRESMSADTHFGKYVVETDDNGIWGMWTPDEGFGCDPVSEHACEDAAKAAAQSDYEACIISALDLTPAPAVEPVAMTAQDAARDVELLLSAYKGLLVLHRIMVKSGLHAGEKTTSELADRIVAAHSEFPARAALRAIGGDA